MSSYFCVNIMLKDGYIYISYCLVKVGKCAKPLSPFQCTGREEDVCLGDSECEGSSKCCSVGCFKKCTFPLLSKWYYCNKKIYIFNY